MDNNIRLTRIDKTKRVGYFWEINTDVITGRETGIRRIEIQLDNFKGQEYECRNFKVYKDGRTVVNEKEFSSIDEMISYDKAEEQRKIQQEKIRAEKEAQENMNIYMQSAEMMLEHAGANMKILRITTPSGEKVTLFESPEGYDEKGNEIKDLVILIPKDVSDASCASNVLAEFIGGSKYREIRFIGGGQHLTVLGSLFTTAKAEILNTEWLQCDNVTDISELFSYTYIKNLDLSFLKKCKIKSIAYTFRGYMGNSYDIIDITPLNLSNVRDIYAAFSKTKAYIEGLHKLDNAPLSNVIQAFKEYVNTEMVIDLSGWNMSNVIKTSAMFESCKVKELIVSNWNTNKLMIASDMFKNTKVKKFRGLEGKTKDAWNMKSIELLNGMFNGALLGENAVIVMNTNWAKVVDFTDAFRMTNVKYIDISRMKFLSRNAINEGAFTDDVLDKLILPDTKDAKTYTAEYIKTLVTRAYLQKKARESKNG